MSLKTKRMSLSPLAPSSTPGPAARGRTGPSGPGMTVVAPLPTYDELMKLSRPILINKLRDIGLKPKSKATKDDMAMVLVGQGVARL